MPFALSLSKGRSSPSPSRKKRTVLRQAQDERFWGGRSLRRLHRARQTRRHLGDVARAEADDHIAGGEIARADARGEARGERARVGDDLHVTVAAVAQPRGERIGRHAVDRTEEHKSELQSLMRISYDEFCLKKKKNKTQK